MKTKPTSRRQFISNTSKFAITCCALATCRKFAGANWLLDEEIPDPKKLEYCGYTCPADCKMLKGTLENNNELKKEAFNEWKLEERFGITFDPEKVICYTCKAEDKPMGVVLGKCTIRECAIGRGNDCCIECDDLTTCEKDLWQRFPDFHKHVIDMQKKYQAAQKTS
jgi:hypothetical protein